MKKLFAILLCAVLTAALFAGCNVQTKDDVQGTSSTASPSPAPGGEASTPTGGARAPIPITLLSMTSLETETNVIRDQLKKAGFDVTLSIQPDYGSYFTQVDARNYDINLGTMRVLTGNPDYGVNSMFHSQGEDNTGPYNNPEVDRLIELAATQLPKDALATYAELERLVVEENAYFVPVSRMMFAYAFNKNLIDESTVEVGQSKYLYWYEVDYIDESLRDTRPLIVTSDRAVGQFDPITQDGTFRMLANTNIRILDLTNDDELTTENALSVAYTIGEGNQDFYFILKDNVNFATAKNKVLADTGVRVGAEDVIFTYNRMRDKNSTPGNKVYDNFQNITEIVQVTDTSVLDSVKDSETGKPIREILEAQAGGPISELVDNKNASDNGAGKYEMIKISTKSPFPQVLNFLCGYEAGIVCKAQVESINNFDVATYDPTKDSRYGDAKFLMEGATYDNHLWCSGPYAFVYYNDYEVVCERNPGYMPGTKYVPAIKNVVIKLISDQEAGISALRSGELDLTELVPANMVSVIEGDSNLGIVKRLINGIYNMQFNLDEGHVTSSVDIRRAILYAVNQDEVVAVKNGMGGKGYTALTMLDTGNEQNPDPAVVAECLDRYYTSIGQ